MSAMPVSALTKPTVSTSGPGKWITQTVDYDGVSNSLKMLSNRLLSLADEGRIFGSDGKSYQNTTRSLIQAWQPVTADTVYEKKGSQNMFASTDKRKKTYLIWGGLDAFYIAWYCVNSWIGNRVPYLSDLSSSIALMEQQGGVNLATALASWLLQISIIASCFLFLRQVRWTQYLAYIQTPLRLFFLIPSISVLLFIAQLQTGFELVLLGLIIISEVVKVWSLRRLS